MVPLGMSWVGFGSVCFGSHTPRRQELAARRQALNSSHTDQTVSGNAD